MLGVGRGHDQNRREKLPERVVENGTVGDSPFNAAVDFAPARLPSLPAPLKIFESARTRC